MEGSKKYGKRFSGMLRAALAKHGVGTNEVLDMTDNRGQHHVMCLEVPVSVMIDTAYGVDTPISLDYIRGIVDTFDAGGREAIEKGLVAVAITCLKRGFLKPSMLGKGDVTNQTMIVEAVGKKNRRVQAALMDCGISVKRKFGAKSGLCEVVCPTAYHWDQITSEEARCALVASLVETTGISEWKVEMTKAWVRNRPQN